MLENRPTPAVVLDQFGSPWLSINAPAGARSVLIFSVTAHSGAPVNVVRRKVSRSRVNTRGAALLPAATPYSWGAITYYIAGGCDD